MTNATCCVDQHNVLRWESQRAKVPRKVLYDIKHTAFRAFLTCFEFDKMIHKRRYLWHFDFLRERTVWWTDKPLPGIGCRPTDASRRVPTCGRNTTVQAKVKQLRHISLSNWLIIRNYYLFSLTLDVRRRKSECNLQLCNFLLLTSGWKKSASRTGN